MFGPGETTTTVRTSQGRGHLGHETTKITRNPREITQQGREEDPDRPGDVRICRPDPSEKTKNGWKRKAHDASRY